MEHGTTRVVFFSGSSTKAHKEILETGLCYTKNRTVIGAEETENVGTGH